MLMLRLDNNIRLTFNLNFNIDIFIYYMDYHYSS